MCNIYCPRVTPAIRVRPSPRYPGHGLQGYVYYHY